MPMLSIAIEAPSETHFFVTLQTIVLRVDYVSFLDYRQKVGYDGRPTTTRPDLEYRNNQITKQIRHQAKVLRDSNIVMGPMSAFADYFDPRNYQCEDQRKYY